MQCAPHLSREQETTTTITTSSKGIKIIISCFMNGGRRKKIYDDVHALNSFSIMNKNVIKK
jgi:hypothetical protein